MLHIRMRRNVDRKLSVYTNYFNAVCKPGQKINPIISYLGMEIIHYEPGSVIFSLPYKPEFHQGANRIAGGIIATLIDESMAHAVLASIDEDSVTATIEMNVRYLKAMTEGLMESYARVIRQCRSVITTVADVFDENGVIIAQGGGSFWVGQRRP